MDVKPVKKKKKNNSARSRVFEWESFEWIIY